MNMVTDPKVKQETQADVPQNVFKDVTYFIVGDVSQDVIKLLDQHGAKRDLYLSDIVSHVIADSTAPDEYSEAKELFERPVVSSQWVILSVKCGKQLPKEVFALEGRVFSGVRVCPHQLDADDAKAIWGMVTFHGGQCQMTLDSSVTHLVTAATSGEKYEAALQHSDTVKIVTPDWITDSIRNKGRLEENVYHPKLVFIPKPLTPPKLEPVAMSDESIMTSDMRVREVEPMDVSPIPGTVPFMPGHSPAASRRKSSSSDEAYKTNGSRPGTPSAKEALARMVSSRLYASGKSELPDMPLPRSGLSPIMHQGPRPVSPGGQMGPMTTAPHPGIPTSMSMPGPGPGHASLGPGIPGQPGMVHTSMGMVHTGVPAQGMSNAGLPHLGMHHPGSVPHPGQDGVGMPMVSTGIPSSGMPTTGIPSSGIPPTSIPSTRMPTTGIPSSGMPPTAVPSSGMPLAGIPSSSMSIVGVPGGAVPSAGLPNPGLATTGMGAPPVPSSMHMQMSGAGMTPHHTSPHPHSSFPPGFPHQHPHQLQQRQHQLQQMQLQQQHHLQQQQQQQQQQHLQQQQQQQHLQHQHQQQLQLQHQQQLQQQQLQQQLHHQQILQHQQQLQQQQQQGPPPPPQPQPKKRQKAHARPPPPVPQPPAPQGPPLPLPPQDGAMREEANGVRTLRNITNNTTSPPVVRPTAPVKVNQMLGLGNQARPPPPAYPYPPQSPGSQPPLPPPHQSHQPPPPPQFEYYGHEAPETIPPDQCLLGCVFYVCDYQTSVGMDEVNTWTKIIEQHGGRVSGIYCDAVTHILCSDQKMDHLKAKALEEEKRVVTAFWLNDCLMMKKMQPPWQALHIPLMFTGEKPCKNQIISITNFLGEERKRVKQMIGAIGAKYTGYMTRANSVLVCKRPGGMKFEKAKEWRVPVVNVQWLSDLVLGQMDALRLPVQMRYLQVGHARDFYADLARTWQWMVGWRKPLKVSKEAIQKASLLPKKTVKTEADTTSVSEPPAKKARSEEDSPTAADSTAPRIIFTGYPRSVVKRLTAIAEKLGGHVTDNPQHCTHLVSQKLTRTIKFFHAINTASHIITKEWLEESSLQNRFQEEDKYQLKDEVGEREVGCNLQESLRKAKTSPIFQGLVFYITPGVVPPVEELKKVIESAGGAVLKRRPSAKTTSKMRDDKGRSTFIVISCPNDLHLCRDLKAQKIDVYSAEMALTGVLRQELDWQMYRLDYQLYAM